MVKRSFLVILRFLLCTLPYAFPAHNVHISKSGPRNEFQVRQTIVHRPGWAPDMTSCAVRIMSFPGALRSEVEGRAAPRKKPHSHRC